MISCEKDCKGAFTVLSAIAVIIVIYYFIMKAFFKGKVSAADFMNKKVVDVNFFGEPCCSLWPLSHFILFFILGVSFPQCHLWIFTGGVIWELVEWITGYLSRDKAIEENVKGIEYAKWWGGSFKDILFNAAGLYLGVLIRYLLSLSNK